MIRTVFGIAFCAIACSAFADNGVPTPADNTNSSVLVAGAQPVPLNTEATAVAPQAATASDCCNVCEVRLGPWQARRLCRQAARQEARDCCKCGCEKCDCCKCKCKCRPTVVVTRTNCCCCN